MTTIVEVLDPAGSQLVTQANVEDMEMVGAWLGRVGSDHTRKNYARVAQRFMQFCARPLNTIRVADLHAYMSTVNGAASTRALHASAIKSLFKTLRAVEYLKANPAVLLPVPKVKKTVAERIMSESETVRLIYAATGRNRVLLTTLYITGARVSELVGLRFRDLAERDGGTGQITLMGKGGKTRAVVLPAETWVELKGLDTGDLDAPVFRSREGGPLDPSQVHRIIKDAAATAGLTKAPSAHWFRHSHATHALDRGAPLHLVQQTLGHSSLAITGMYLHARPSESSSKYLKV